MAEREGQQFGNYRLTRLLGKGAFAEVYLAEQVYLGTEAAIKVLHTQLANASEIEKFRMEARTIATLVHPNIVRVLDFGVQENTPYLIMDYAPNGSMRQKFPGGKPLAPSIVLPYLKQVAEALQYAHDQRLIHRDVKPENMLLGRNNEVLLSDFGIALVAQSSDYQKTQGIAGTAAYMAPEQLQGKPRPASDQYALGIVAYEWLSGERPFNGTFTEVAGQHMMAAPPPLRQKVPALSADVERVVLTALAKDPKDRFANMRAFATALEQAILSSGPQSYATNLQAPMITPPGAGVPTNQPQPTIHNAETVISVPPPTIPVPPPISPMGAGTIGGVPSGPSAYAPAIPAGWAASAPPVSPPPYGETFITGIQAPASAPAPAPTQPPSKGIPRRAVIIAGAGALALVGGGAGAYLLLQNNPTSAGNGPNNATPSPTGAATATTTTTATSTTTETATTTPTEAPTTAPAKPGDIVFNFIGHSQEVTCVAWHPNSRYLASGSYDTTARMWDTGSNQLIFTYTRHTDQIWALAWSPDSKHIATGGKDKSVQIWDSRANQSRSTYTGHSDAITGLAWSPDSVLIASASYDTYVRVWEALTQQFHYAFNGHTDHVWCVAWSPNGNWVASGSRDKTVWVWDPTGGNGSYTYTGHSEGVSAVAWSPNSQRIASGSYDRTVQVWDATTGGNVLTYNKHSANVTSVDWSPNGQYIVSASQDGKVHVWNASNGNQVLVYSKQNGSVDGVAWTPNGKWIASVSADKSVQVWLAP